MMYRIYCLLSLMLLLFLISLCYGKSSHSRSVPTYFHRSDKHGELLDRTDPAYENIYHYRFIEKTSDTDRVNTVLKVKPFYINNGEEVDLFWYGVNNPSKNDFIGLYCPVGDKSQTALDYFFVTESKRNTWSKGHGSKRVTLFNMRITCEFRYFRVDETKKTATRVATSNVVSFLRGADEPLQGHIALTGNPSEMRVMWTSGIDEESVVIYGQVKSNLFLVANGTAKTYKASDMCGPPANGTGFKPPGFIHTVLLKNLLPNTKYYYAYGTRQHLSAVHNFTTALPAGDKTPYKFIVYGDMGVEAFPQAKETAVRMLEEYRSNNIRLILHDGDISYARGYAYIWDQWHAIVEPYAVLMPYMVTIGNHEQDHLEGGEKDPSGAPGNGFHPKWGCFNDDSFGECGVPMYYRFNMPDNGNALWWYSFDYGLVHFLQMSTEHDYSPGSRQYKWLENDLRNVNRTLTPWVIITGHRAMYCSQNISIDWKVSLNMQRLFEDLLYKYRVDLAFWAHYHSYERTCKVYRNVCQDGGMVHIVVGTAGKDKDTDDYYGMKWSLKRVQEYGYGRVSVLNETALQFEFLRNKDRKLMDELILTK